MKPIQKVQFLDKYAQWIPEQNRRETYTEAVDRTVNMFSGILRGKDPALVGEIQEAMMNGDVMPSMRAFSQAGKPIKANHIGAYNCSYSPLEGPSDILDGMIILAHGCGFGYSVEYQNVDSWPTVLRAEDPVNLKASFMIEDSIEGWSDALCALFDGYFNKTNKQPIFDYSMIRAAGSPLHTRGGTASGPKPLKKMLDGIGAILAGVGPRNRLQSIDIHDMMCMVAESIIAGGKRRSAMIALFSPEDWKMMTCKGRNYWEKHSYRAFANNSIVVSGHMDANWWLNYTSVVRHNNTGEPGIFSRRAARLTSPILRDTAREFGTNPCGEIVLRPRQFCNLSIAVAKEEDTLETMAEKVRLAAAIGTLQSTLVNFKGISREYERNSREERLLGVDITGVWDSPFMRQADKRTLEYLKNVAIESNSYYADLLGIVPSTAVTCIKPGGNSSVLLDSSSGIHPRSYAYYVRRMRISASSPVAKLLIAHNVPYEVEVGTEDPENPTTLVFEFPMKSPEGSTLSHGRSAIQQLEFWKLWKEGWCEHNPSVTIEYKNEELNDIAGWLYENQDIVGGFTLFPRDDTEYGLMPKEKITAKLYSVLESLFPIIDFDDLIDYEVGTSGVTSAQEYACVSGACDI